MIRFSQIAASAAVGAALFIGAQGCTHDRADEVPASASEISTGTETVSASAPHDGMIYIWDQTANKMLYTGRVEKGDTVRVDAKHDRIYMNDKLMTKRDDLTNDHHYKVFFDQSELDRARGAHPAGYQTGTSGTYGTYGTNGTSTAAPTAAPAPSGTTVIVPDNGNNGTTVVVPPSNNSAPAPATPNSGTTVIVPDRR